MNDILKYWPIKVIYDGKPMMIPMGEIRSISKVYSGTAGIDCREGDSYTTDSPYDDAMAQWNNALKRFAPQPNQKWEVT